MKEQEHHIQIACINWFRYQYPSYLIYAIPNGGQRNRIVAAKLKAEGVLAGVPDIHIPFASNSFHGLYIEMKSGNNKPTKKQMEVMKRLADFGYQCEVCYSFDDFQKTVMNYLK